MNQVKFGIRFSLNTYAYAELDNFIECADSGIEDNLRQRYVGFLQALSSKQIKPSTPVDVDVLNTFIEDLEHRAQIDYIENHWEDDPNITAGGRLFLSRAAKLKSIHHAELS